MKPILEAPQLENIPAKIERPTRQIGMGISGKLQVSVVKNGEVIRQYPEQSNLILNRFMERLYSNTIVSNFTAASASTGTLAVAEDSGVTTASQTTTTVTLSGGSYVFTNTATDENKIIKWDTGEMCRIVSVASPTSITVTPSQSVGAGEFTVYNTQQVGMSNKTDEERTVNYLTGSGNCGTTPASTGNPTVVHTRTYDFPIRANNDRVGTPYAEVGWSENSNKAVSSGDTINSRVVLLTPVAVATGEQLRVKYSVTVTFSPTTSTAFSAITGWGVGSNGVMAIQKAALQLILTTGVASDFYIPAGSPLEPSHFSTFFVSDSSVPLAVFPADPSNRSSSVQTNVVMTKSAAPSFSDEANYPQPNTLFHDKIATFSAAVANQTIRSMHIATNLAGANVVFSAIMDSNQTKDSLHSLVFSVRYTYTRIIS